MRFEVLTGVNAKIMVPLGVTPFSLVDRYQCFGINAIFLQGK
jgi:hypothetical protein